MTANLERVREILAALKQDNHAHLLSAPEEIDEALALLSPAQPPPEPATNSVGVSRSLVDAARVADDVRLRVAVEARAEHLVRELAEHVLPDADRVLVDSEFYRIIERTIERLTPSIHDADAEKCSRCIALDALAKLRPAKGNASWAPDTWYMAPDGKKGGA